MIKKLYLISLLSILISSPLFAVNIRLPSDNSADLSINTSGGPEGQKVKILGEEVRIKKANTTITSNEKTVYTTINLVNKYLRRSFSVIAMGLIIYAGYLAISSGGDSKVFKKIMRIFIGIGVGLFIAMISSALIKIIVNLI